MRIHNKSSLSIFIPLSVLVAMLNACTGSSSEPVTGEMGADVSMDNTNGQLSQSETNNTAEVGVATVSESTASRDEQPLSTQTSSLINNLSTRCIVVDESFDLSVTERLISSDGSADQLSNVSAYANLFQDFSTSVELLSRTDEMLSLVMRKQDVASITTTVDDTSVTAYLGAFSADAPATAVLKKPIPGGCLYALRLDTDRHCAATVAKGATVEIKVLDEGITMTGCTLDNPSNYPVIELPAEL